MAHKNRVWYPIRVKVLLLGTNVMQWMIGANVKLVLTQLEQGVSNGLGSNKTAWLKLETMKAGYQSTYQNTAKRYEKQMLCHFSSFPSTPISTH